MSDSSTAVVEAQFTFVHAVEQITELLWSVVRLMFLPRVTVIAAQHNQLPLLPPHGAKMRDLHNHRAARETRTQKTNDTNSPWSE